MKIEQFSSLDVIGPSQYTSHNYSRLSEGITSVLSALGFLNPGLHLMQTLFYILNLEQSSQLLRILLITCNFSFNSLWGIQSLQHTLKYKAAAVTLGR
jgi:hypothetical protein